MKLTLIAGARPNFMKIAPIIKVIQQKEAEGEKISYRLVHTGQHFDAVMSGDFFTQLQIPEPHAFLHAGGGTQAEQTAAVMVGVEKELQAHPCDLMVVVGDVTSTMAAAITARKMQVPVAHVEAGIRSGDWTMPEEINRVVTDSISNLYFTTSAVANQNLLHEGVAQDRIHFVGNTMIDTLHQQMDNLKAPSVFSSLSLQKGNYIVLTLHRPANVDDPTQLALLFDRIHSQCRGLPILFPVHPRTRKNMEAFGINTPGLHLLDPLPYLEFNWLVKHAKAVITDSGGITEETTVMGIPCVTLRNSTERPETVTLGTNELVGNDPQLFADAMSRLFQGQWKKGGIPPLWDGKTAERIIGVLLGEQ